MIPLKISFLIFMSYVLISCYDNSSCYVQQASNEKVALSCNDDYFTIAIADTVFPDIFYHDVLKSGFALGTINPKNSKSIYSYSCYHEKTINVNDVISCDVFNGSLKVASLSLSAK